MKPVLSSQSAPKGSSPHRLLLSYGLPLLLLLAFLGRQFISFDSIGWNNGFNHPLTGWDHLVTMLAVGIWAAQLRGQAIWMLPMAFVGVMSLGGLAGAAGLTIPSVEGIILLSVAVFSVLITRKIRFNSKINVLIVAFFAFFHGFAHGQEISTSASLVSYTLGFMLATLLLHGAGILVAKLVVIGITCLLTLSLSNASPISTDTVKLKKASSDQARSSLFWLTAAQTNPGQLYPFWADDSQPVNSDENNGTLVNIVASNPGHIFHQIADIPIDSQSTAIPTQIASHAAFPLSTVSGILPANPENAQPYTNSTHGSTLDFKHYYPDINHTPGRNLLSNGVGLTSPPLNQIVTAASPYLPRKFCNTSASSVEERFLHLFPAKLFGTLQNHHFRNDYIVGNLYSAVSSHSVDTYPTDFFSAIFKHTALVNTDSGCINNPFSLHSANTTTLPLAVSAHELILTRFKHNKKLTRDFIHEEAHGYSA